jgi:23S rRNA pseudouridine2605 synthase
MLGPDRECRAGRGMLPVRRCTVKQLCTISGDGSGYHGGMPSAKLPRRIGLARALSKLGYCSRSRASELVRTGRVAINGMVSRNPEAPVDLERDHIEVDSHSIDAACKLYLMLNKPRGLVTTSADEQGRDTIYSCLPSDLPWLAPVGRLDKASEGLLLLTNDSEWAARLLAPETHLLKTYHVQIAALADHELLQSLRRGITDRGESLRVRDARVLRRGTRNSWLEIVLDEGKNRHIRRMLAALGAEVLRLVRIAIGPLALGELPKGSFRELTASKKRALDAAMKARPLRWYRRRRATAAVFRASNRSTR